MGKFVITTGANGQYYFSLLAGNGQKILSSEGYTAKASCMTGIESVKANSKETARYEKKTSANGKFFFNLKASNGQIIGTSEMYESAAARDNGISSVQSNAADAPVSES